MLYAFDCIQTFDLGLIKISVILFYRRIFRGKIFNFCSKAMLTLICLWTLIFGFFYVFRCGTKISALWSVTDTTTTCYPDDRRFFMSMPSLDIATDIIILSIPLPIVSSLHALSPCRLINLTSWSDLETEHVLQAQTSCRWLFLTGCTVGHQVDLF